MTVLTLLIVPLSSRLQSKPLTKFFFFSFSLLHNYSQSIKLHTLGFRSLCNTLYATGSDMSQVCCALYPLCHNPDMSQARCTPYRLCHNSDVSQVRCTPYPLCPNPVVHPTLCVTIPMCPKPVVHPTLCVTIPMCPKPVVHPTLWATIPIPKPVVRHTLRVIIPIFYSRCTWLGLGLQWVHSRELFMRRVRVRVRAVSYTHLTLPTTAEV